MMKKKYILSLLGLLLLGSRLYGLGSYRDDGLPLNTTHVYDFGLQGGPEYPASNASNVPGPYPTTGWWEGLLHTAHDSVLPSIWTYPNTYQFLSLNDTISGMGLSYTFPGVFLNIEQNGRWYTNYNYPVFTNDTWYWDTNGYPVPDDPHAEANGYFHWISNDMYIRTVSMPHNNKRFVTGYGDWSVDIVYEHASDPNINIKTTLAKGSPFTWLEVNDPAGLEIQFMPDIDHFFGSNLGTVLANVGDWITADHIGVELVPLGDRVDHFGTPLTTRWGFYVPAGTVFSNAGPTNVLHIHLPPGENYVSIANLLEDFHLNDYYPNAYAFVTDTRVDWDYDQLRQEVITTFEADSISKRTGFSSVPILGMLPHHWKHSSDPYMFDKEYWCVKGKIYPIAANSFSHLNSFSGMIYSFDIPWESAGYDTNTQREYLDVVRQEYVSTYMKDETYAQGKTLAYMTRSLLIADRVWETNTYYLFRQLIKNCLADWFTYEAGEQNQYFSYYGPGQDDTHMWGTLVGQKGGFGTPWMNDHDFHYGYFIYAAAAVAFYWPEFIDDYGWMVELLIRDINSPYHNDSMFPRLRYFDPFDGHCWSQGPSWGAQDQESTSEAINAWVGIFLWGLITGNQDYIELGTWGYTLETEAYRLYYANYDGDSYNPNWNHNFCGILGANKNAFRTYFHHESQYIYGIQWLPMTPSMMYFAYDQANAERVWDELQAEKAWQGYEWDYVWFDSFYKYQSLFDPTTALQNWATVSNFIRINRPLMIDGSESDVYWFVHNMNAHGRPVSASERLVAEWPGYQIFEKGGTYTYYVFNPTTNWLYLEVHEAGSCIGQLKVPPRELVYKTNGLRNCGRNIEYFTINHDGYGIVGQYERVTITAYDPLDLVKYNYGGTVTLSNVPGPTGTRYWFRDPTDAFGVLTDNSNGTATYSFSPLDQGQFSLYYVDYAYESIDLVVDDGLGHHDTNAHPQYLLFTNVPTMDHFEFVMDGLGFINVPEPVTVRAISFTGDPDTAFTGTVILSNSGAAGNISWAAGPGASGSLTDLGGGIYSYTFAAADMGEAALTILNDTIETINPQAVGPGGEPDSDRAPSNITFYIPPTNVYIDIANTGGPWDGQSWATAYTNINDGMALWSLSLGATMHIAAGTYITPAGINCWQVQGLHNWTNTIKAHTNGVIIDFNNTPNWGITINNCDYIRLEGLRVTGARERNIMLLWTTNTWIERCIVDLVDPGTGFGGIVADYPEHLTINSCSLAFNQIGYVSSLGNDILIQNTIAAWNNTGIQLNAYPDNILPYNNTWSNSAYDYFGSLAFPGEGSIFQDPLWLSTNQADWDYMHIGSNSPMVDRGNPDTPVPYGGGYRIDIGWFEYLYPNTPPVIDSLHPESASNGTGDYYLLYTGTDRDQDANTLGTWTNNYIWAEYSTNPGTWTAMTADTDNARHSVSPMVFMTNGQELVYTWSTWTDLGPGLHNNVYIRLRTSDGTALSAAVTNGPFTVDNVPPVSPIVTLHTPQDYYLTNRWQLFSGMAFHPGLQISSVTYRLGSGVYGRVQGSTNWSTNADLLSAADSVIISTVIASNNGGTRTILAITNAVDLSPPVLFINSLASYQTIGDNIFYSGTNYDSFSPLTGSWWRTNGSDWTALSPAPYLSFNLDASASLDGLLITEFMTSNAAGHVSFIALTNFKTNGYTNIPNTNIITTNTNTPPPLPEIEWGPLAGPNPLSLQEESEALIINLTPSAVIRIYTLNEELVRELDSPSLEGYLLWDLQNTREEDVAPGLYFLLIEDDEGHKTQLKLTIIE